MASLQVGRPAVREAPQDSQRMRLVTITHGGGARLLALTARTMLDQIAGTAHPRQLTANPAAPEGRPHVLQDGLGEACRGPRHGRGRAAAPAARCRAGSCRGPLRQVLRADVAFHRATAEIAGNPISVAVSEAMLEWLAAHHVGLIRKIGRERLTLHEHGQVVDRIAVHDVDGAAAAMFVHLTRAHDLYMAAPMDFTRRVEASADPANVAASVGPVNP